MPYRTRGRTVQVKKGKKWKKRAKASSAKSAKKMVRLLNAIKHGFKPRR